MDEGIYIDQETIIETTKLIRKEWAKTASNFNNFDLIKKAAINFLNAYKWYKRLSDKVLKDINEAKAERAESFAAAAGEKEIDEISKKYLKARNVISNSLKEAEQRQVLENVYRAGFIFQDLLNSYLGQSVKTVIVFNDDEGNPKSVIIDNSEDFIKYLKSSITNEGIPVLKFDFNKTDKNNLFSEFKGSVFEDYDVINGLEQQQRLVDTYKEVVNRFKKYRSGGVSHIVWGNPHTDPKFTRRWKYEKVYTMGSINEAYMDAFLKRDFTPAFAQEWPEEPEIDDFMRRVESVTNLSGLLKGDVSLDKVEYAIKSSNASMLGLPQIEEIASEIKKGAVSSENLKEYLDNKEKSFEEAARAINSEIMEVGKRRNKHIRNFIKEMNDNHKKKS